MNAKLLLTFAAVLLLAAALLAASPLAPSADRPQGIPNERWHALTPTLGLILPAHVREPQPPTAFPHVTGTLVAKIKGQWFVVHLPAPARHGPYFLD